MLNVFIALLVCKGTITEREGKELAKRASLAVLPHEFSSSLTMVKGWLEEIESGQ